MTTIDQPNNFTTRISQIRSTLTTVVVVVGAIAVFAYVLLPFFWMLKSSLQSDTEIMKIPPLWLPSQLSIQSYQRAVTITPFARYIVNSIFVSAVTTTVSVVLAAMAGYVLARHKFPGATLLLVFFLFTQLIPSITRVFPVYFMLQRLHLLNSYIGLIIAYISFSLPYGVLMLQGYFRTSYPPELEEAALLDGCTWFSAFMRIVLPISVPGIVAVATYCFLGSWNDFLWASLLLSRGDMKTIQVGLRDFVGEFGVQNMNSFMAACLLTTIPAIILYGLGQKYIVQGMSAGAVKGRTSTSTSRVLRYAHSASVLVLRTHHFEETHVHITIQGDKFYMDGKLTYSDVPGAKPEALGRLMNSRMVQATFEDENPETAKLFVYPDGSVLDPNRQTNEFCAALPEYRRYGVIACTVNFQGGYPQYHVHLRQDQILQNWDNNAFAANGSLKWRYAERMQRVIEAADKARIAIIVGYFYFGQNHKLAGRGGGAARRHRGD